MIFTELTKSPSILMVPNSLGDVVARDEAVARALVDRALDGALVHRLRRVQPRVRRRGAHLPARRRRGQNRGPKKIEWSLYSVKKCLIDAIWSLKVSY